jgi:hypothetical protein
VVVPTTTTPPATARISPWFFPGKYTGLREKPYYDEVLTKLLSESEKGTGPRSEPTPSGK